MIGTIEPYADYILMGCHSLICIFLLPTIWAGRHGQQIPYLTSIPYIGILAVLGLALLSQGLIFGAATDFLGAALWGVVAGERAWHGLRSVPRKISNGKRL